MGLVKKFFSSNNFADWALILTLVAFGGFNEYICCAAAVLTAVLLIIKIVKNTEFRLRLNSASIAVFAVLLGYLISSLYAVDKGLAVLGIFKFLPVPLFLLLVSQDKGKREELIERLPLISLVLGVCSLILMYLPFSAEYFSVAGRLAGTLQYPNSFAMFLAAGMLVSLSHKKISARDIIFAAALFVLLLLTGSRAVMVIAVLAAFFVLFFRRGKAIKIILGGAAVVLIAAGVIVFLAVGADNLPRFLTFSVSESTFAGRLLYMADALPLALTHPFGLGYLGYFSMENWVQTGVYAVRYVHNDILQTALDVGLIPCAALVFAFIRPLFDKSKPLSHKIILLAFFAHSLFDFDLQFAAIFFVLILFMDGGFGKEFTVKNIMPVSFVSGVLGAVSLYFAIALALSYFGLYKAADSMYPANTENTAMLLSRQESPEKQGELADRIIRQNKYVSAAYNVKARLAFSEGDFEKLIEYKHKAFEAAPFDYDTYEEYCYMLIEGELLYTQAGDSESAGVCRNEFKSAVNAVLSMPDRLSGLGKIIVDQPKTDLPEDILEYAKKLTII